MDSDKRSAQIERLEVVDTGRRRRWTLSMAGSPGPFDLGLKLAKTYWIVCPKATSMKPKIATFRDWLLAEAADDTRRLRKIFASRKRALKRNQLASACPSIPHGSALRCSLL